MEFKFIFECNGTAVAMSYKELTWFVFVDNLLFYFVCLFFQVELGLKASFKKFFEDVSTLVTFQVPNCAQSEP